MSLTPALSARETGRNVRRFIGENKSAEKALLIRYMPWIVGAYALVIALTFVHPVLPYLAYLPLYYAMFMLLIAAHRLFAYGAENAVLPALTKPEKRDWKYMGAWVAAMVVHMVIVTVLSIPLMFTGSGPLLVLFLCGYMVAALWAWYRFVFYMTSIATHGDLSLKEGWKLGKGYVWKTVCATFFAVWRLALLVMGGVFVLAMVLGLLGAVLPQTVYMGIAIALGLAALLLYILVLLRAALLSMGCITNYYLYARQHKGQESDAAPATRAGEDLRT